MAKQPDPRIKVTVIAILASDAAPASILGSETLRTHFALNTPTTKVSPCASENENSLGVNEKWTFVCFEEAQIEIEVKHCVNKEGKACLTVRAPQNQVFQYTAPCDKFLAIMTFYQARERIPPVWVAQAMFQCATPGPLSPVRASATLLEGRTRPRLMLAICVQPCKAKRPR